MNKQEQLAEQIANILYEANGHCGGAAQVTAAIVEAMGVQQLNSDLIDTLHEILSKEQRQINQIYKLATDALKKAETFLSAPAKAVEAPKRDDLINNKNNK